LAAIFKQAEEEEKKKEKKDSEQNETLQSIFRIVRLIINIAEFDLMEKMLSEEYYLFTFGALECMFFGSVSDEIR